MRLALIIALALLLIAAVEAPKIFTKVPPDPHQFFNHQNRCFDCHDKEERSGELIEHLFIIDMVKKCYYCHPREKLGRSHPVLVSKDNKYPDMNIPQTLPLDPEGNITCGTCHNPHVTGYSTTPLAELQDPFFIILYGKREIPYYQTYYLRMTVKGEGFAPLCKSCHADY